MSVIGTHPAAGTPSIHVGVVRAFSKNAAGSDWLMLVSCDTQDTGARLKAP